MIFISISTITIEYSLACLCVGTIVYRLIFGKSDPPPATSAGAELATAYLLGQGAIANIWVLVALAGWFNPVVVDIVVFILAITGIILNYNKILALGQQLKALSYEVRNESRAWKLIIASTLLLCAAWGTSIGGPPNVDGSGFYLAIAKVTADSHRLTPLPGFEALTGIGLQGEMHFAALMSLGSPGAARLFSWPTILAGAVLFLALAKRVGLSRHGQWLALAMVFTSSAVIELSGSGKTDLFAAALGLAAYHWAMRVREVHGVKIFGLLGILVGLTLIAKISYLVTFVPSIGIIVIWSYLARAREPGITISEVKRLMPCLLVGIAGLLIAILPHLIKNHLLFENVLAPFGTGTTGFQDQPWYGPETTHRILISIPLALTYGDYWAQLGNLSPLVLATAPLVLLVPMPPHLTKSPLFVLAISSMIGVASWFILFPSNLAPRYFLACLLLLILPSSKVAELIASGEARVTSLRSLMLTIFILTTLASGAYYLDRVFFPKQTYAYLAGELSGCQNQPGYCEMITIINQSTPAGGRLFTNTFFRYWLRSDLIQCALTTDETNAYLDLDTPDQRWGFIYGRGFKSMPLFNVGNRIQRIAIEDLEHIPKWLRIDRIPSEKNVLLRFDSVDPSHRPLWGCKQIAPPAWDVFNLPG